MKATYIMSSGIDHYLKMWNLQQPKLEKAIEDSETYTQTSRFVKINKKFKVR